MNSVNRFVRACVCLRLVCHIMKYHLLKLLAVPKKSRQMLIIMAAGVGVGYAWLRAGVGVGLAWLRAGVGVG